MQGKTGKLSGSQRLQYLSQVNLLLNVSTITISETVIDTKIFTGFEDTVIVLNLAVFYGLSCFNEKFQADYSCHIVRPFNNIATVNTVRLRLNLQIHWKL